MAEEAEAPFLSPAHPLQSLYGADAAPWGMDTSLNTIGRTEDARQAEAHACQAVGVGQGRSQGKACGVNTQTGRLKD